MPVTVPRLGGPLSESLSVWAITLPFNFLESAGLGPIYEAWPGGAYETSSMPDADSWHVPVRRAGAGT